MAEETTAEVWLPIKAVFAMIEETKLF